MSTLFIPHSLHDKIASADAELVYRAYREAVAERRYTGTDTYHCSQSGITYMDLSEKTHGALLAAMAQGE